MLLCLGRFRQSVELGQERNSGAPLSELWREGKVAETRVGQDRDWHVLGRSGLGCGLFRPTGRKGENLRFLPSADGALPSSRGRLTGGQEVL